MATDPVEGHRCDCELCGGNKDTIESLKLQVEAYRKALGEVCLGKEADCCRWCGATKGQAHYEPEACSILNRDTKA